MKRLLLVLATLLVTAALAAGHNSTKFTFGFPTFAAVFTNIDNVEFFTGNNGTAGKLSGKAVANTNYYAATEGGITQCIDEFLNNQSTPISFDISQTGNSKLSGATCYFAPNSVTKNNLFKVTGYGQNAGPDGELLVITNANTFNIGSQLTGGSVPNSGTLEVYPGYLSGAQLQSNNSNSANWKDLSMNHASSGNNVNPIFTKSDAYNTQYSNAYVIPLLFRYSLDVLSASTINSNNQIQVTVTWDAAVQ